MNSDRKYGFEQRTPVDTPPTYAPAYTNVYSTTTTITTTTAASTVIVAPRFDPSYSKTLPGILKIVNMVLDIFGFICIMVSPYYTSRGRFFSFVSMTGFWLTASLLFNYLFHLVERTSFIPWLLIEFAFNTLWTIFYVVASACVADYSARFTDMDAYAAAAFFGFGAMAVYGADAFIKFRAWRNNELAQGELVVPSSHYVPPPTTY